MEWVFRFSFAVFVLLLRSSQAWSPGQRMKEAELTLNPWEDAARWNPSPASLWKEWETQFHHQSAICRLGGVGQLVLWIRPPQSTDRLLPNTRVSASLLTSFTPSSNSSRLLKRGLSVFLSHSYFSALCLLEDWGRVEPKFKINVENMRKWTVATVFYKKINKN